VINHKAAVLVNQREGALVGFFQHQVVGPFGGPETTGGVQNFILRQAVIGGGDAQLILEKVPVKLFQRSRGDGCEARLPGVQVGGDKSHFTQIGESGQGGALGKDPPIRLERAN
jgi:hypothetical protein